MSAVRVGHAGASPTEVDRSLSDAWAPRPACPRTPLFPGLPCVYSGERTCLPPRMSRWERHTIGEDLQVSPSGRCGLTAALDEAEATPLL